MVEKQMEQFRVSWSESRKKLSKIYRMVEEKNGSEELGGEKEDDEEQLREEKENFIDKMNESKIEIALNDEEQNLDSIIKVI